MALISRELDEKCRAYAYFKVTGSQQVCKVRMPLWGGVSLVDKCIEFLTYHGMETPTGKMSLPLQVVTHFETRWVPAEADDDDL